MILLITNDCIEYLHFLKHVNSTSVMGQIQRRIYGYKISRDFRMGETAN